MREIKFRVWHKELKGHYKVESFIFNCDGSVKGIWVFKNDDVGHLFFNIEYTILEQYTGLKDKNGVEIYEGDYLKWDDDLIPVVFKNGAFMLEHKTLSDNYTVSDVDLTYLYVSGNINENKEMLENE